MGLATAFGVLWAVGLVTRARARGAGESAERVEKRFLPIALRTLAWAVLATGIALTQSRGGITAAAVTTVILFSIAVFHPRAKAYAGRALRGTLVLFCGLLFVAAVARSVPLLRFLASDSRDLHGGARLPIWETSLDAWRLFPVFGSGLGTFREAFRRVQPRELNGLVEKAHSDPLQLLVTGGAAAEVFGILLYASLFVLLLRQWKAQRHREECAMVLAGLGALLSLTLHGFVEYTMSVPAIPAVLACVLGMAWAAGGTSAAVRSP
jgi:O-antigen ligase